MDSGFNVGYSERRQKSSPLPPASPLVPAPSDYMRRKRTHSQMELEDSSPPPWGYPNDFDRFDDFNHLDEPDHEYNEYNNERPHPRVSGLHLGNHQHSPPSGDMPSSRPRRFPGDGLDFRRPVSSTNPPDRAAVIDLTADDSATSASNNRPTLGQWQRSRAAQRLPRSEREIIHLDDDDDVQVQPPPGGEGSPEVQFISSRTRETEQRTPSANRNNNPNGDDVQFVRSTTRPGTPTRRWAAMPFGAAMLLGAANLNHPHLDFGSILGHIHRGPTAPPRVIGVMGRRGRGGGAGHSHTFVGVGALPGDMDYGHASFDMHTGASNQTAPRPTIVPPTPAPAGFTRSPTDEGPLICPNCEHELCVGDTELKKQAWVIKGCGHVREPLFTLHIRDSATDYRLGILRRVHRQSFRETQGDSQRQGENQPDRAQALQGMRSRRLHEEDVEPQIDDPGLLVIRKSTCTLLWAA